MDTKQNTKQASKQNTKICLAWEPGYTCGVYAEGCPYLGDTDTTDWNCQCPYGAHTPIEARIAESETE